MDSLLGTTLPVFLGLTFVLFGGAAFLTGQAIANGWNKAWRAVPYCLLLGCGERFLTYALFNGKLLHLTSYLIHTTILLAICLTAYSLTKARKMVTQYPWLYERAGPFGWRERPRPG